LSIVLVIIGLIVGGVLVGQNLIDAAAVRAQISQIERYNTAANTFRGKYGYLPGDIPDPTASQFGFQSRGPYQGQGDGNGIIQGNSNNTATASYNVQFGIIESGEPTVFWTDLSKAGLIDGTFSMATATYLNSGSGACTLNATPATTPSISAYLPAAKIGGGNYVSVWSGGPILGSGTPMNAGDSTNYFALSSPAMLACGGTLYGNPGLTVQQAAAIDAKVDDGFPQSGNVTALYVYAWAPYWAAGGGGEASGNMGAWGFGPGGGNYPTTSATPGSAITCYDNGNVVGGKQQYSVEVSGGANVNCALSFRFQ
jgi:hypothetical protein